MYFGLTNSLVTFQTMMNYIFCNVILKHELQGTTIQVYMDDIGIATRTDIKGHIAAVRDVLVTICVTLPLNVSLDLDFGSTRDTT